MAEKLLIHPLQLESSRPDVYRRINPRVDYHSEILIKFDDYLVRGLTTVVSEFGGNVKVSLDDFKIVQLHLKEPYKVTIILSLHEIIGEINCLFEKNDEYFLGLKILEGRWV